jgi:hypothetical protein
MSGLRLDRNVSIVELMVLINERDQQHDRSTDNERERTLSAEIASGRTFARLVPSENTADVLATLRAYCERYGIPNSLYIDHGSVFYAAGRLT